MIGFLYHIRIQTSIWFFSFFFFCFFNFFRSINAHFYPNVFDLFEHFVVFFFSFSFFFLSIYFNSQFLTFSSSHIVTLLDAVNFVIRLLYRPLKKNNNNFSFFFFSLCDSNYSLKARVLNVNKWKIAWQKRIAKFVISEFSVAVVFFKWHHNNIQYLIFLAILSSSFLHFRLSVIIYSLFIIHAFDLKLLQFPDERLKLDQCVNVPRNQFFDANQMQGN